MYYLYQNKPPDFKVGTNGCFLSGGQRQKISVARSIALENKLIIFDEATSNIDAETENLINQLLLTKLKDKTIIAITHKTSILPHMDKVILLKNGQIDIIGNHEQLIEESQLYRNILHNRSN